MALERFANTPTPSSPSTPWTTLAAGIDASVTSLTVVSASAFPSAAQYRILIDNELLLVTAGGGTTTWTVTRGVEGSTAATHASGANVFHTLTAAALALHPRSMTTAGDTEYLGATGAPTRLAAPGNGNYVTTWTGGVPSWSAAGGGSGDVVGPASSVDNAIVRFDSTTGKLVQGYTSGAPTISDTGAITANVSPAFTLQRLNNNDPQIIVQSTVAPEGRTHEAPFEWFQAGATFESEWDTVMYLGYNASRGVTTQPAMRWCVEGNYHLGSGRRDVEMYWEYIDRSNLAGATTWRPIFITADKDSLLNKTFTLVAPDSIQIDATRAAPLTLLLRPVNANQPVYVALGGGLGTATNSSNPLIVSGGSSETEGGSILLQGNTSTGTALGGDKGSVVLTGGNVTAPTSASLQGAVAISTGATPTQRLRVQPDGNIAIWKPAVLATAYIHIGAGTTAASTAPLKFTSGSLNTAPEAGAVEFLTDAFYGTITTGAARKTFAFLQSPSFTTPNIGVASGTSVTMASAGSSGAPNFALNSSIIYDNGGTLWFKGTGNSNYIAIPTSGYVDGTIIFSSNYDVVLQRAGAAGSLQLGNNVNGAAVAQTFKAHDGITGTNIAGANLTIAGGRGTGSGAPGNLLFQTATTLGSGTTAQTLATRLTVNESGLTFADAMNIVLNTTTGTKIGTATTQKLAFYDAPPIIQGASVADATDAATAITQVNALISRLEALGLIATV